MCTIPFLFDICQLVLPTHQTHDTLTHHTNCWWFLSFSSLFCLLFYLISFHFFLRKRTYLSKEKRGGGGGGDGDRFKNVWCYLCWHGLATALAAQVIINTNSRKRITRNQWCILRCFKFGKQLGTWSRWWRSSLIKERKRDVLEVEWWNVKNIQQLLHHFFLQKNKNNKCVHFQRLAYIWRREWRKNFQNTCWYLFVCVYTRVVYLKACYIQICDQIQINHWTIEQKKRKVNEIHWLRWREKEFIHKTYTQTSDTDH